MAYMQKRPIKSMKELEDEAKKKAGDQWDKDEYERSLSRFGSKKVRSIEDLKARRDELILDEEARKEKRRKDRTRVGIIKGAAAGAGGKGFKKED